jgi:hypothetical protein
VYSSNTPAFRMAGKSLEKNVKVKLGLLEAKVKIIFSEKFYNFLLVGKSFFNFMVQSGC